MSNYYFYCNVISLKYNPNSSIVKSWYQSCTSNKMNHSRPNSKSLVVHFLGGFLLLCMSSSLVTAKAAPPGNETDLQALLDLKSLIVQDPFQIMTLWNNSIPHCNWVGITCNISNGRVMNLTLAGQKLAGTLPQSIGNLTFLTGLDLLNNSFHGELPDEMGRLLYLQRLILSVNYFGGKIPSNLSHCTELRILAISLNEFTGQIPLEMSSLRKLDRLLLGGNNLTGRIPAWICNISYLSTIFFGVNKFHGSIPNEVGLLSSLTFLGLNGNYLSGTIPPSVYNISSIYYFTVAQNNLHGNLPADVGFTLPNLQIFAGGVNNFTGTIPESLSNASSLEILDFAENGLTGTLPKNIGSLHRLIRLNFDENRLGTGKADDLNFLSSLANCTDLEVLGLAGNGFGGELTSSNIANLSSQLRRLTLGSNKIHGRIPVEIGNLANLALLGLEGNTLSGPVPDIIGMLQNLEGLSLNVNNFSGLIPSSLGNLTRLTRLSMEENNFEGNIPTSIGKCENLLVLSLHSNKLNGTIPKQVIGLSSLSVSLDISHNFLTGPLPAEVSKLDNLAGLDLSDNKLYGVIPSSLGSCISLERLRLQGNLLDGSIPQTLRNLRALQDIDLSHNNLSGKIPEFLGEFLLLKHLNLSYNNFEGEIPKAGIFKNASAISIFGNSKLCGGIQELNLPPCTIRNASSSRRSLALKVVIPVISALVLVIILSYFMVKRSRKKTPRETFTRDLKSGISYSELVKYTDGFSQDNLIGSGSFGSVYKGTLPDDGAIIAVKVLNLQQRGASTSFTNECEALRSVRHRNLLKIITAISGVDHQGNDFKALIFEFISNGNLDNWLHPVNHQQYQSKRLTFIQRLNIAIDVASALEYLHHFCQTPIVHCDIKPSNVLLDTDMVAHVGDFGLAKFLFEKSGNSSNRSTVSSALKGSTGYIPPEYGMGGQPSTLGDIYSYGVLLLETFTGKRPTDEAFEGGMGIHQFAEMGLPNNVMDIVDPLLLYEDEFDDRDEEFHREEKAMRRYNENVEHARRKMEDSLVSVMQIGVSCSATSPSERIPMTVIVNKLHAIKNSYMKNRGRMTIVQSVRGG